MIATISFLNADTDDGLVTITFNVDTSPCTISQCPHFNIRIAVTHDDGRIERLEKGVVGWTYGESQSNNFDIIRDFRIQGGTVTAVPYIEQPEFLCSSEPEPDHSS